MRPREAPEAFMETMKAPEFVKCAEEINMDINPLGWQDVKKIVDAIRPASL